MLHRLADDCVARRKEVMRKLCDTTNLVLDYYVGINSFFFCVGVCLCVYVCMCVAFSVCFAGAFCAVLVSLLLILF